MNLRDFTSEQIDYIYSNRDFVLFLNKYFSTYNVYINSINIDINIDDEHKVEEIGLYLRIILANIDMFKKDILDIERNISYIYLEEKKNIQGEIKGLLLIDEYIRKKSMQSIPKTYPCVIKSKSYLTPENLYLLYIIDDLIFKLEEILLEISKVLKNFNNFTEINLLKMNIKYFKTIKNKPIFSNVRKALVNIKRTYGEHFPIEVYNKIQHRIKKRQIINSYKYKCVFQWHERFRNNSFAFIDNKHLNILSYDNKFNDKLFELWVLFNLKETLINEYKLELIESNHLVERSIKPIFKIKSTNGNLIELYFQKGKDLFWTNDNENRWKYVKANEKYPLRGIPDIAMKYYGEKESIVLIDVKNRIRIEGKNSEEIYKALGYYGNFSDFLQLKYGNTFKYNAVLVFRNDKTPFKEILNTDMDDSIFNISVSPSKEMNLNINQFKELCRYLLEVCGKEGNIAEVVGEYKKDIEAKKQSIYRILESDNEDLIEEVIFDISNNNHKIISNIFNAPELQEQLDDMRLKLERDHFPHIWEKLHENTRTILSMAENLFMNIKDSRNADYAPICLEYCRAIEYELNNSLIKTFREKNNVTNLINRSNYYKKLIEDRDLTLGEVIFLLSKCNVKNKFSTIELKDYINKNIKNHTFLLNQGIDDLDDINKGFRRRAAHTSIINYKDLIECRQRVLGIGYQNLFYILLD